VPVPGCPVGYTGARGRPSTLNMIFGTLTVEKQAHGPKVISCAGLLSVLIVNWNTREHLRACLDSLGRFPPAGDWETIVVDNASSDGSAEMVRSEHPWAILVEPGANLGYAAGNNAGFAIAKGEMILTLNPDTRLEDDSLDRAVLALNENAKIGAVSVRLVGLDGETQRSIRGFPTLIGVLGHWTGLDRVSKTGPLASYSLPQFDYSRAGPAPQPMGTFLLFRRSALETVGAAEKPFDERFPIFFNEVDLLYRLHQAGWTTWYLPDAHVVHAHGASTSQVRPSMIWESHRSLVRYFSKHLRGAARLAIPFVAAAAWVAALVRAKGVHAGFRPHRDDL
jgi:GT2 family glycosyltransferase